MHEDFTLGLLSVEIEGGFPAGIDADSEVQEAEAGGSFVSTAVFQLETYPRVLGVEKVSELSCCTSVSDQGVAVVNVA